MVSTDKHTHSLSNLQSPGLERWLSEQRKTNKPEEAREAALSLRAGITVAENGSLILTTHTGWLTPS